MTDAGPTLVPLAMFPLGTVLFPHVGLPLRVFEPRYQALMKDCLRNTQEFGVRQALGATRADILRLVLSRGVLLTIAGLGAGLLLSIAATRLLASLLYQVDPVDMATLASVSTLLLIASLGAACIPAWRAACVSAAAALRGE